MVAWGALRRRQSQWRWQSQRRRQSQWRWLSQWQWRRQSQWRWQRRWQSQRRWLWSLIFGLLLFSGQAVLTAAGLVAPGATVRAAPPTLPGALPTNGPADPQPTTARTRVTLILAAGWDWDSLRDHNNQGPLVGYLDRAGIALMNTATGGWMLPEHDYATMAAGIRAVASAAGGRAYARTETVAGRPAAAAFRELTGQQGSGTLLHLGLGPLTRDNNALGHRVRLGGLGDTLATAGMTAAVFGNADLPGEPARHAVVIAMDSMGQVPSGLISDEVLMPVSWLPGGRGTDWARLLTAWQQQQAAFSVVETGDLWRLQRARADMTAPAYDQAQKRAVMSTAAGVALLLDKTAATRDANHLVLLVSPAPVTAGPNPQGLGWAAAWWFGPGRDAPSAVAAAGGALAGGADEWAGRPGGGNGGFLMSATTRRPGFVSLVDLAPTIADYLGVSPVPIKWTGRPLGRTGAGLERWQELSNLNTVVTANHRRRIPLIQGYVAAQIGVIFAAIAGLLWAPIRPRLTLPLGHMLWLLAIVPLVYLILPLLPGLGLTAAVAWLAVILGGASFWYHHWLGRQRQQKAPRIYLPFTAVALATVVVAIADTAAGGYLAVRSPFGYSLVGGARYYGIGNEYMGVLLGAGAVALGGLLEGRSTDRRRGSIVFGSGLAGLVLLFGTAGLGANFGGSLSAAVMAAVAVTVPRQPPRLAGKVLFPALAALGLTAVAVLGADLLRGEGASHIGLAAQGLQAGDLATLADILRRKGAVNLRLIRWTIWNRVFIVTMGAMFLVVARPVGMYRRLTQRYPYIGRAAASATAGSGAALLLNDSGIVAAATTLLLPAALLLSLVFLDPQGLNFTGGGRSVDTT